MEPTLDSNLSVFFMLTFVLFIKVQLFVLCVVHLFVLKTDAGM